MNDKRVTKKGLEIARHLVETREVNPADVVQIGPWLDYRMRLGDHHWNLIAAGSTGTNDE